MAPADKGKVEIVKTILLVCETTMKGGNSKCTINKYKYHDTEFVFQDLVGN